MQTQNTNLLEKQVIWAEWQHNVLERDGCSKHLSEVERQ